MDIDTLEKRNDELLKEAREAKNTDQEIELIKLGLRILEVQRELLIGRLK